ncbi:MAG: glycoside hydrolase family 127 protein [Ktedonobacteraceae bacterium]|nr:glycoside hydrolase family 127 protein [Ktedonobacteraceae bacterium]
MHTPPDLLENTFDPLSLGNIHPTGWLLNQLRIQANGLSGHLDEFWPDIADSAWIGGSGEGWERAPYWLDGLVPLAFLLDDERLKSKVQHWINYILDHQQEDGWLGPIHDTNYGYQYDPWPVYIVLKALTQYYEATTDPRVIGAMEGFLRRLQGQVEQTPLTSWAQLRGADLVLSIYWLYRRTQEEWLLTLASTIQQQTFDWQAQFVDFPYKEKQTEWQFQSHVVNNAMALKQPALWYQLTHNEVDRQAVEQMMETLDTYHGQVTGVFSGDEVLAGKNPSQGTELCAVVEYMFSLETLLAISGTSGFADRLERIAFNALPATFKPDMWAHQYDQQVNQVICAIAEDHLYTTNGSDANIFGLAPNFGCCTANMHQGWPKLATHLWMQGPDDSLVALVYAPCTISTIVAGVPVHIEVQTLYPFEEDVHIHVSSEQPVHFLLQLRIPEWAKEATVRLDEQADERVQAGTFYVIEQEWNTPTSIHLRLSMPIRTQTRYANSMAIERGPLVYSLQFNAQWRQIGGILPHADWEVHPLTSWNYAMEIDREHPERSCSFVSRPVGTMPFSPEGAPIHLKMHGRRVPQWTIEHNAAGPLPQSPVRSTEPRKELTLIPYGCTDLRVTEFPTLEE